MTRRRKLLLTFLAGIAGLLLAEAEVRVLRLGIVPPVEISGNLSRDFPVKDPILRVENMPHGWVHVEYQDRYGTLLRAVDMRSNSMGLRGPEVTREKPPGTFRIACFGDSQTYGHGVQEGEDYPRVLEGALRKAHPGTAVEVLNFGVGGYETEEEVELLRQRGLDFQPDLVLIGFFLNDTALPGAQLPPREESASWWIHFLAPSRPGTLYWFRQHLRTLDIFCDWKFRKLVLRRWVDQRGPLYADDFDGWIRVQALLRKARELLAERSARFAVMLVPLLMEHEGGLLSDEPYRKVDAFCRAEGIPCFNPAPLFRGLKVDVMRVHSRDVHSGTDAQRMIGEALAQWLVDQKLVPVPDPGTAPGASGR